MVKTCSKYNQIFQTFLRAFHGDIHARVYIYTDSVWLCSTGCRWSSMWMKTPSRRGWSFSSSKTKGQVSIADRKCQNILNKLSGAISKNSIQEIEVSLFFFCGVWPESMAHRLRIERGLQCLLFCFVSWTGDNTCNLTSLLKETLVQFRSLVHCVDNQLQLVVKMYTTEIFGLW